MFTQTSLLPPFWQIIASSPTRNAIKRKKFRLSSARCKSCFNCDEKRGEFDASQMRMTCNGMYGCRIDLRVSCFHDSSTRDSRAEASHLVLSAKIFLLLCSCTKNSLLANFGTEEDIAVNNVPKSTTVS